MKVEHEGPPWRVPRVNLERYVDDLVTAPSPRVEKVPAVNGWELRLMGDQRTYTRANGTKFTRTVSWHLGSPEQARHYGKFLWQVAIDAVDVHWQDIDRLAQQLLVRRSMTGREVIAFLRDDPAAALLVAELLDRAGPAG